MAMLGIIHTCTALPCDTKLYSDVVECWLRMLEVLGSILGRGKRCLTCFHLLQIVHDFI